jgi:hypothetical protein
VPEWCLSNIKKNGRAIRQRPATQADPAAAGRRSKVSDRFMSPVEG